MLIRLTSIRLQSASEAGAGGYPTWVREKRALVAPPNVECMFSNSIRHGLSNRWLLHGRPELGDGVVPLLWQGGAKMSVRWFKRGNTSMNKKICGLIDNIRVIRITSYLRVPTELNNSLGAAVPIGGIQNQVMWIPWDCLFEV